MNSYLDVILNEEGNEIRCISRLAYIASKKPSFNKEDMGEYTNRIVKTAACDHYMTGLCIVQVF